MIKTGKELRDEAIDQVEDNANALWLEEAVAAIEYLSALEDEITADSVWDLVGSAREPRAMGAAFRIAAKRGLIAPTQTYKASVRPTRHAGPIRVWATL
jgi:hypothetical protein